MSFNKKQLKKDSPKKNAIDLKLKQIKKNPNYKYGFSEFQPGEGNLMLGAGFGNSKIGMGAMGMTPLDAENRKYFKGLVDANINYNINPNLNFKLGINDVIGGGFNPNFNAGIKLKFEEGGEYIDLELDENDIEYYKNQGYLVEYLEGGDVSEKENKDAAWAAKIRGGLGPEYANYNDQQIREMYDQGKLMTKFGEDSYIAPELDEVTITSETDKERRDAYLAKAGKYFKDPNDFQTENKEWIKNWIEARNATGNFENQLGNGQMEKGFKSLDEVKKISREEMAKIHDDASFWQMTPPVGMYSPGDQKYFVEPTLLQKLKGKSFKYTDVHEQGHVFDIGTSGLTGTYMEEIPETNIHKAIKNIPTKGGYETEEYLPAAEIYAELIKFRRKNKINPNKVFTEDDLPKLRKKLKKENAYGLFKLDDIYGDKEILRLMNEVATINTPQENNLLNEGQLPTAQNGGPISNEGQLPKAEKRSNIPPEQEAYKKRMKEGKPNMVHRDANWAAKVRAGLPIEFANYNDDQIRELYENQNIVGAEAYGDEMIASYQLPEVDITSSGIHKSPYWNQLPEHTKKTILDFDPSTEKMNPMVKAAMIKLRDGHGMINPKTGKVNQTYTQELLNNMVYPGLAIAAAPLAIEGLGAFGELAGATGVPQALWAGANAPIVGGAAGTSLMDGLGYYGMYQGAKHLPGHVSEFAKDPSWKGAGKIGLDALGIAGGAYSAGKLLKNLPGAQFLSKTTPGSARSGTLNSGFNPMKTNQRGAVSADLKDEYKLIEQQAKANGTWMKDASGMPYKLPNGRLATEEEWLTINSSNFKKSYPDGFGMMTSGRSADDISTAATHYPKGRSFFGGDPKTGMHYAPLDAKRIVTPDGPQKGAFELIYPLNSKGLNFGNNQGQGWRNIGVDSKLGIQNTFNGKPGTFRSGYNAQGKNQIVSTDDIAAHLEQQGLPYASIDNIFDGVNADNVTIVNHMPGNYLKSLIGNTDFNLNNPNIYKAVAPILGTGLGYNSLLPQSKQIQKEFAYGGLIKNDGPLAKPQGDIYLPLDGTEPEHTYLELDDNAIQQYRNGGWVVEEMPEYEEGGRVSEMWEKETGTPWSEAKAQGLSDGSYASNIALRKRLVAGEFSNTPVVTPPATVPTNTPMELIPEPISVEPIIKNNSNFEIPNEIVPSAKQVAALSNDKGAEGLASNPNFAKVYNPLTIKNPFEDKVPNDEVESSIQNAASFSEAFSIARKTYGPNYIFEYKGRSFGTNKKGEDFKPTNKILKKHKLDTPEVKKRIEQETKEVESPFFSKETIKLEPDGYESWEDVKLRKEEFNKQDNADKIIDYHKNSPSKNNFVIVDKSKGLMHIYKPNGELLYSEAFDVNTGKNEGDDQTVTKPKDLDGDGRITNDGDRINGKFQPDWSAGNKKTGAGKYYISNIDPTGYGGLPILNMMNERQYDKFKETGKVDNVATSFHKGYISGDDTRRSNGCVRCTKPTLEALTSSLKNLSEVYILPDNDENKFVYENGQLNFRPKLDKGAEMTEDGLSYLNPKTNEKSNIPYYKDERGEWQKGQGVNKTNKTLNYLPIEINTDRGALKTWGDKNMSGGYDGTLMGANYDHFESAVEPFVNSLAENKQNIMQAAQINGDVYNEIAKMTLGIYGTESSFGDTHSSGNNFVKAARKWYNTENSSPDYWSKYHEYDASGHGNSVGLTQYRWKWALEDAEKGGKELEVLKKVGITKNSDFMDPEKAALGTAAILAYRYNTQLSSEQKKDMWNHLPGKWNTRDNYGDRVKNNSSLFSISQMTEEANNERLNEIDKINKKRKEDALPANVQARYEASLKRKAELEKIEAAKSPEQKAKEKKVRNDEYIPEAESTGINMPTFEQYPQLNFSKKDENYGSAKTLSAEEADRLRPKRPRTKAEINKAYRTWANSTPELTKRYGKKSIYDLDATGKPNEWFDKAYKAGKEEYKASLLPVKKNPPNLHLKNYRKYGGEIKPKDIFIEYLKRKKGI